MFLLLACLSLLTAEPADEWEMAVGFGEDPRMFDLDPFGLDGAFDTGDMEVAVGGAFDLDDAVGGDYNDLDFLGDFDNALKGDTEESTNAVDSYMGKLDLPVAESTFGILERKEESIGGEAAPPPAKQTIALGKTKSCVANGLWCKCGFQSLFWAYERVEEGKKDCYTLEGMCQTCGVAERITSVGFDYKYEKKGAKDVYDFRYKMQMENWWDPPKYRYHCLKGYAITGVKTAYQRITDLGDRDVYSLQIKCGKIKTKIPKDKIPVPGLTWYNCETKEDWSAEKKEWCSLNGYNSPGAPAEDAKDKAEETEDKEEKAEGPQVTTVTMSQSYSGITDCGAYAATIKTINAIALDVAEDALDVTPGEGCTQLENEVFRRRLMRRFLADVTFTVKATFTDDQKEKATQVGALTGDQIKDKVGEAIKADPNLTTLTMVSSSKPETKQEAAPKKAEDAPAPAAAEPTDAPAAAETTGDAAAPAETTAEAAAPAETTADAAAPAENTAEAAAPAETTGGEAAAPAETTAAAAEETTAAAAENNAEAAAETTQAAAESAAETTAAAEPEATSEAAAEATGEAAAETTAQAAEAASETTASAAAESQETTSDAAAESQETTSDAAAETTPAAAAAETEATAEASQETTAAAAEEASETTAAADGAAETTAAAAAETTAAEAASEETTAGAAEESAETTAAAASEETTAAAASEETTAAAAAEATDAAAAQETSAAAAAETTAAAASEETTAAAAGEATEAAGETTAAAAGEATEAAAETSAAADGESAQTSAAAVEESAQTSAAAAEESAQTSAAAVEESAQTSAAADGESAETTADAAAAQETTAEAAAQTTAEAADTTQEGDSLEVMTAEGEDTGKTCAEAWKELKEAVPSLTGCPNSLKEQCPATCADPSSALGLEAEMELAEEQPVEPTPNHSSLGVEVSVLILGSVAALVLTLGIYTWIRKGDSLHVEYLLADQDEYANYVDEF